MVCSGKVGRESMFDDLLTFYFVNSLSRKKRYSTSEEHGWDQNIRNSLEIYRTQLPFLCSKLHAFEILEDRGLWVGILYSIR